MIYNCFTFYNEFDLLELRLEHFSSLVHKFVIAESRWDFQGKPKPLYLRDHWSQFDAWKDKIELLEAPKADRDAWGSEAFQRNWLAHGLVEANDDDLAVISDADEFPDFSSLPLKEASCQQMDWFYYFANLHIGRFQASVSLPVRELRRRFANEPCKARWERQHMKQIDNGWHFSYLGGADAIKTKIESFAHTEFLHCADKARIEKAILSDWKRNVDVLGRDCFRFTLKRDEELPEFMQKARKTKPHLFYEEVAT